MLNSAPAATEMSTPVSLVDAGKPAIVGELLTSQNMAPIRPIGAKTDYRAGLCLPIAGYPSELVFHVEGKAGERPGRVQFAIDIRRFDGIFGVKWYPPKILKLASLSSQDITEAPAVSEQ